MKIALLILMLIGLPLSASAQIEEQIEEFAAGITIGSAVNQLKDAVNEIIRNADDSISSNSFQIRQHCQILLNQLDALVQGNTARVFQELRDTEQQLFFDIRKQVEDLRKLEEVTASDIKQITNNLATAIGNMPLGQTTPRVLEYEPFYVSSTSGQESVPISVNITGFLLAYGNPSLELAGTECTMKSKVETGLSFSCPASIFATDDGLDYVDGILKVYKKSGFFASFFIEPEEFVYNIAVNVVPREFGRYAMVAYVNETRFEVTNRSQNFKHTNAHCEGSRDKYFNFSAQSGWTIDVNSIKPQCSSSRRSSCNGLRNVGETGFQYNCTVSNSGTCFRTPFGTIRDARGSCWGSVKWTETKPFDKEIEQAVLHGSLEWGNDVALALPAGTTKVKLTVTKNLEPNQMVTSIFFESNNSHNWYEVDVNLEQQFVRLRPRTLKNAMSR